MSDGKILRSYTKIWDYEKKIYALFDWRLPVPINPRELGYFGLACIGVYVISRIIPPFAQIPFLVRYGMIPYGLTQFLLKKRLDGKRAIPFFRDWLLFQAKRKCRLERFKQVAFPDSKMKIRINGRVSCRR